MKCKQTVALFDAYINGTISPAEKQALKSHLETCESCKKQLELYHFYFSDVKIEEDFPVPAQLNAKIKYTLQQARDAKEPKKLPFWQNKRILSAATACAFLFVAGILGASNYDKLQNASGTPVLTEPPVAVSNEIAKMIPEETPSPTSAPTVAKVTQQTPQVAVISESVPPQDEIAMLSDAPEDIPAYSEEEQNNAVSENVQDTSATGFSLQRTVIPAEDVTLSIDWKESILLTYPHEILSDDLFLVAVTPAELEIMLGYPLDTEETKETKETKEAGEPTEPEEPKDQLIIRFINIEE